jgi:hypothetical protein
MSGRNPWGLPEGREGELQAMADAAVGRLVEELSRPQAAAG